MSASNWRGVDRTDSAAQVAHSPGLDARLIFLDIVHTWRLC